MLLEIRNRCVTALHVARSQACSFERQSNWTDELTPWGSKVFLDKVLIFLLLWFSISFIFSTIAYSDGPTFSSSPRYSFTSAVSASGETTPASLKSNVIIANLDAWFRVTPKPSVAQEPARGHVPAELPRSCCSCNRGVGFCIFRVCVCVARQEWGQ